MMKEYHIEFKYRSPDHVFVKIEDETRKEITVGSWEGGLPGSDSTLITLVLPAAPADPGLLEACQALVSCRPYGDAFKKQILSAVYLAEAAIARATKEVE